MQLELFMAMEQTYTRPIIVLWLGRVWSGKTLPALIEERIIPDQLPLYQRCISDASTLKSSFFLIYCRPSGWPIPALHGKTPT